MIGNFSHKRLLMVLFCATGLLALLFGVWTQHNTQAEHHQKAVLEQLNSGYILPIAKTLAPFSLHDTWGHLWDNAALHGHFSVLFFGFTHCPDMCPTTLSQLNQAYGRMEKRARSVLPEVIFVSIDPQRDSLDEMKRYLSSFNAKFKGVVGDESHLLPLKNALGVLSMKVMKDHTHHMMPMNHGNNAEPVQHKTKKQSTGKAVMGSMDKSIHGSKQASTETEKSDYDVDHSGSLLVINPEGKWVATLTPPHQAETLAKDLERVIHDYYHP